MLPSLLFCTMALCMVDSVFGHMQMKTPYPLRSKYNPKPPGPVDYDMSAPLAPDGSNFPCKLYNKDISGVPAVETYTAGQSYSITFDGSASHLGGSCQISLSYDGGANFNVIHSIIGGCPLKSSYDFTVPKNAPNAKGALLAWTWFNEVGNREMYMNCAVVDIVGGSQGTSLNTPAMFRANTYGGTCITPEGVDFVFPNPGDSVEYGGVYVSKKPSGPTAIQGCPGNAPPPPPSQDKPTDPATTQQDQQTKPATTQKGQETTTDVSYPTLSFPVPTDTVVTYPTQSLPVPTTAPVQTTIESQPTAPPACDNLTTTVVQTVTQTHTEVQYVTVTKNSDETKITRTMRPTPTQEQTYTHPSAEACNQAEAIQCYQDGKKWKFCDGKEWIDMDECAKGQMCKDGKLVDTGNQY